MVQFAAILYPRIDTERKAYLPISKSFPRPRLVFAMYQENLAAEPTTTSGYG